MLRLLKAEGRRQKAEGRPFKLAASGEPKRVVLYHLSGTAH